MTVTGQGREKDAYVVLCVASSREGTVRAGELKGVADHVAVCDVSALGVSLVVVCVGVSFCAWC